MPRPKHPTLELARWYITRFEDDEAFADRALSKLFAIYPNNNQREDILLKVAALNSLYHTNVFAVDKMAKHIFGLLIDSKLENCSIDVVNEIAFLEIDGKTRRHYSFATKYCSWHKPEIYPIYDRYLEQLLWAYQKADRFASLNDLSCKTMPHTKALSKIFELIMACLNLVLSDWMNSCGYMARSILGIKEF